MSKKEKCKLLTKTTTTTTTTKTNRKEGRIADFFKK